MLITLLELIDCKSFRTAIYNYPLQERAIVKLNSQLRSGIRDD